jgi:hypothetical protein
VAFVLKKVGLWLGAILAVFLGYVAVHPPDYVVSREISINAPAEKIFSYKKNFFVPEQQQARGEVGTLARSGSRREDGLLGA